MVLDPVADLLTRLANGSKRGMAHVMVPNSNFVFNIAEALKAAGYVRSIEKKGKKVRKVLEIELAYDDGEPRIHGTRRRSKLSRREYMGARDIRPVKSGHGHVMLSTPEGVLTGTTARKKGVGGEVLFEIW